ncbi:uncharacterized protein METZ01_LOCUS161787, partial [marine metagenome]
VRKGASMKYILYIMVTVFLETGEPLEH